MKCALELKTIRAEADALYEEHERELDAEAMIKYQQSILNAIELCEVDVDNRLTEQASNRRKMRVNLTVRKYTDRLNNVVFKLVTADGRTYANGRPSYCERGKVYAYEPFIDYLKAHCLCVSESTTDYQSFGRGSVNGTLITIEVGE
jgi:hypothetical protein